MKFIKLLTVAALGAAALSQSAWATGGLGTSGNPDHVYITGSSAFRGAALLAIASLYDSGAQPTQVNDTGNGTSEAKTTYLFYGGAIGGVYINIAATFTGSVSGIYSIANPSGPVVPFLNDTATSSALGGATLAPSAYQDTASSIPNTSSFLTTQVANVAFSDVDQASTVYNAKSITTASAPSKVTWTALTDTVVGIPTFKWLASFGFPSGTGTATKSSYSISDHAIKTLFSTGYMPASFITGQTADEANEVDATGRNPDSGTRITALNDSGYGSANSVVQYQETALSGAQVTTQAQWVATTGTNYIGGFSVGAGNNGAGSGGDLRVYMGYTIAPAAAASGKGVSNVWYVTYLGLSDAGTAEGFTAGGSVAGPGVELYYNGVQYSPQAVYSGAYSFWGYEHLLNAGALSTNQQTVYTGLANYLTSAANVTAIEGQTVGIAIGNTSMLVQRGNNGTAITPKSTFPY